MLARYSNRGSAYYIDQAKSCWVKRLNTPDRPSLSQTCRLVKFRRVRTPSSSAIPTTLRSKSAYSVLHYWRIPPTELERIFSLRISMLRTALPSRRMRRRSMSPTSIRRGRLGWSYDVTPDGTVRNGRTHLRRPPLEQRSDLRVGRIQGGSARTHLWRSPRWAERDRDRWHVFEHESTPANQPPTSHREGDGQTLFITGGSLIYRLRLTISGARY